MHGSQPVSMEVLLAHLPLFGGLGPEELARISRGTRQIQAGKDTLLFSKGERCEGFHLIVVGRVKLVFTTADGVEQVVEILGQGQTFGETLMLTDQPYDVSARALSDCLLLHISKATIFEEFDKDPGLRLKMVAGMSRRLRELMDDVESFSLHSGKQRVVNYFLHLLPEYLSAQETVLTLPTSKANIASRLNLTQEHFSRILRDLSTRGVIAVQGGQIVIRDVQRLRGEAA
jgi:CRP-like cAMP-binding protein